MSLTEPVARVLVTRDFPIGMQYGERLAREVAFKYGITYEDVIGRGRHPRFVQARVEISRDLRAKGYVLTRIAKVLHRTDHAAIVHYLGLHKGRKPVYTPEWQPDRIKPCTQAERILAVLTSEWMTSRQIAAIADFQTKAKDRRDLVSRVCVRLLDKGLVQRGGTPWMALWRKA